MGKLGETFACIKSDFTRHDENTFNTLQILILLIKISSKPGVGFQFSRRVFIRGYRDAINEIGRIKSTIGNAIISESCFFDPREH